MYRLIRFFLALCVVAIGFILLARVVGTLRAQSLDTMALRLHECSLPCWLHLTPGETSPKEALQALDYRFVTTDFPDSELVKTDGLVNLQGMLWIPGTEWSAPLTMEYFDGRLLRLDLLLETHSLRLGDVLSNSGMPTCVTPFAHRVNRWILIYHEPSVGMARVYVEGASTLSLSNRVVAIVLSRVIPGRPSECHSGSYIAADWHGTAPRWRYYQLAALLSAD